MIVSCWLLSFILTLVNIVGNVRQRSVMIDTDCPALGTNTTGSLCIHHQPTSIAHHIVFHLSLIVFCLVCLTITATCYIVLFRVISRIVKEDIKAQLEMKEFQVNPKQVARRRMYVVMIGSVIVVYSAYLSTYAVIQAMHLLHLSGAMPVESRTEMLYLKYICYLFLSLHSLLQPFCFLRMREFRMIIHRTICGRWRRESILSTGAFEKRQSCQPVEI